MSSLKIAVGFAEPGNKAKPFPIYVGHSGAEMAAALKNSAAARFEIFSSAFGIRKNNPRAKLNAERINAEFGRAAEETATELATLREKVATLERNLLLAEDAYIAANAKAQEAEARAAEQVKNAVELFNECKRLEQENKSLKALAPAPEAPAAAPEITSNTVASAAEPDAPAAASVPSGAAALKASKKKPGASA